MAPLNAPLSEDCLYLNIWWPSGVSDCAKLPVIFWIHGGGFTNGGASLSRAFWAVQEVSPPDVFFERLPSRLRHNSWSRRQSSRHERVRAQYASKTIASFQKDGNAVQSGSNRCPKCKTLPRPRLAAASNITVTHPTHIDTARQNKSISRHRKPGNAHRFKVLDNDLQIKPMAGGDLTTTTRIGFRRCAAGRSHRHTRHHTDFPQRRGRQPRLRGCAHRL